MKSIFVFFIIISLFGCYSKEPEKTGLENKPFPSFSLLLADSTTLYKVPNEPNEKGAAILYFATYCPYSREQVKEIVEDIEQLKDIQFYFVTAATTQQELNKFIEKYQLNKYNNIITGLDTSAFIPNYYEIPGVPYMILYSKAKKTNKAYLGKIFSSKIIEGTHINQ